MDHLYVIHIYMRPSPSANGRTPKADQITSNLSLSHLIRSSRFRFLISFTAEIMQNAVMHAAMTRIGLSELASQAIVEDQGIDSLKEILLSSDDEIESLRKVIR
jgi:hypothetical protein